MLISFRKTDLYNSCQSKTSQLADIFCTKHGINIISLDQRITATHVHTHAHSATNLYTHSLTHAHTHSQTHSPIDTNTLTLSHTHTQTHTHALTYTHAHSPTHTLIQAPTHITHTFTYTQRVRQNLTLPTVLVAQV